VINRLIGKQVFKKMAEKLAAKRASSVGLAEEQPR
jgi:hypothetical protein